MCQYELGQRRKSGGAQWWPIGHIRHAKRTATRAGPASFDCAKATTAPERAICGSDALALSAGSGAGGVDAPADAKHGVRAIPT
jgi:hypothetical protein